MPPARWSTRLLPPRQTHEDRAGRGNLQTRPRARGLRLPPLLARGPAHSLAGPGRRGGQGGRGGAGFPPLSSPPPYPTPHVGPALRKAWTPPATAPALGSAPAGGTAPGHAWAGTGGLGDEGWARGVPESGGPRSFPGAGPRERGASACVHAPLTELLAAGQPLITRGPASPLDEASHTFAADWPASGPAPSPAPRRGEGRAAT